MCPASSGSGSVTSKVIVTTNGVVTYTTTVPCETAHPFNTAVGTAAAPAGGAEAAGDVVSTTVVTITSCVQDKCSTGVVTTGVSTISKTNTVYTTFVPLPVAGEASPAKAGTTGVTNAPKSGAAGVSSAPKSAAPAVSLAHPVTISSSQAFANLSRTISVAQGAAEMTTPFSFAVAGALLVGMLL